MRNGWWYKLDADEVSKLVDSNLSIYLASAKNDEENQ